MYSDFTIDVVETYVEKINKLEVKLRADMLRKLLVSLDKIDRLKLSLSELCITIEYGNIKVALMTCND
jgi:Ni,Fe-hydrogenase III large subunit